MSQEFLQGLVLDVTVNQEFLQVFFSFACGRVARCLLGLSSSAASSFSSLARLERCCLHMPTSRLRLVQPSSTRTICAKVSYGLQTTLANSWPSSYTILRTGNCGTQAASLQATRATTLVSSVPSPQPTFYARLGSCLARALPNRFSARHTVLANALSSRSKAVFQLLDKIGSSTTNSPPQLTERRLCTWSHLSRWI